MFTFLVKTFGRRYPIPTTTLQLCSLCVPRPHPNLRRASICPAARPNATQNMYEKLPKKYISYEKKRYSSIGWTKVCCHWLKISWCHRFSSFTAITKI
jgi:hypothetical protein